MDPQRVSVVGVGAVGCFFAAHLSETPHSVVACARRPFDTYRVESPESPIEGPAEVLLDPADVDDGPHPFVLVGVKAHQTEGAADWLDAVCGPDSIVVAMQNGIEAVDRLAPYVNGATVLPAVVYCGAELVAPGHVDHTAQARLILPEASESHVIAELFEGTAASIEPSEDHLTAAWFKLSINTVINGLTALTGRGLGVVADPAMRPVSHALFDEVLGVAAAAGAEVDRENIDGLIDALGEAPDIATSMLHDVRAGRVTEHEAIHGAVIRAARRAELETPYTDMLYAILAARSNAIEASA